MTDRTSIPQNDDDLTALTKEALADILGREPTKQEILRAHVGFKRMAFVMMDHLEKENKKEKSNKKRGANG